MTTVYIFGSTVYGTNNDATSDVDVIVILSPDDDREKLAARYARMPRVDVSFVTEDEFRKMVEDHDVRALECISLDYGSMFPLVLDKVKLRQSFAAVSSNSWVKAKKKMTMHADDPREVYIGKKSAWHSLRILDFAIQIAEHGYVEDFNSMTHLYPTVMAMDTWDDIWEALEGQRKELAANLRKACPKPIISGIKGV